MSTQSKSGKSMLLILVVMTVASIGIGTGIGIFMGGRGKGASHGKGEKSEEASEKKQPGTVYSLGEMTVNLADMGNMRYAKVTVAVGIAEKVEDEKLKPLEAPLKDAILSVVSNKRFDELHRAGGMDKLKEDLQKAITPRVTEFKVEQIYLEALAMQ